mmetsp:Transcript_10557/g.29258  ORF Transcript_10557/g.29258 Transcript_10557/m.29258 type:complete len:895 (-) Transcript_10557:7-2691(-)
MVQWKYVHAPGSRPDAQGPWCSTGPGTSVEAKSGPQRYDADELSPVERLALKRRKRDQLKQRLETRPDDAKTLMRLAHIQQGLREVDDFVQFSRSLCARSAKAWRSVVRVHQRLGRTRDAVDLLLEMHREVPGNAEACCALAKLEPSRARHWYEKAFKADPSSVDALLAIADVYRKAERFAEAARFYESAHRQSPLAVRPLYRLGEALVQDGRGAAGRQHLVSVLANGDGTFHLHAAVMIALSYVMDQQHTCALEYCRRAGEIHRSQSRPSQNLTKLAQVLKGITELRIGSVEQSVETLSSAASEVDVSDCGDSGPARWSWDEMIQSSLGLAATLQGDFSTAERHFEGASRLDGTPSTDVLVNMAYLRQVQGESEAAQELLLRCLESDPNSPLALMRMGYLLLCDNQIEKAIQFLQKCLQQPSGTIAYGAAQKGAAHLYLCIAYHWLSVEVCGFFFDAGLAEEHFRSGSELLPDLRRLLAETPGRNAGGPPGPRAGRLGLMDLTSEQASVLMIYSSRNGGPPPSGPVEECAVEAEEVASVDSVVVGPSEVTTDVIDCEEELEKSGPTLVGTASTTASPSRNASDPMFESGAALSQALNMSLRKRLPPEKVLSFEDLELGECISHGEYTTVHRGRQRSSQREVVVKLLHQKNCTYDEQAAAELRAEIAVISELNHPRLVPFVGACLEPSNIAMVTELAPGGNLHHVLHVQHRSMSRRDRFQLAIELLEGVRYLHARTPPVAHLDLKSLNLVLNAEGTHLWICDFGLARVLDEEVDDDRPLRQGGSHRYMAPECYDSNLGLTEKADVWSSGCILLEIFGECLPYAECSNVQQILKLMLVHRCGPSVPATIEAPIRSLIVSMLAFDVQERLSIAQALLRMQMIGGSAESKSRFIWIP